MSSRRRSPSSSRSADRGLFRAPEFPRLGRHRAPCSSTLRRNSPPADRVILDTLRADRADLLRLLQDVDVVQIAEEALQRTLALLETDCPVDLYLTVGVGAANAGELVVGGRGIAFICLEHFTGRANPQTNGLGSRR